MDEVVLFGMRLRAMVEKIRVMFTGLGRLTSSRAMFLEIQAMFTSSTAMFHMIRTMSSFSTAMLR
ncbi:hypothetical protein [Virgibacillus ainsalahensis]